MEITTDARLTVLISLIQTIVDDPKFASPAGRIIHGKSMIETLLTDLENLHGKDGSFQDTFSFRQGYSSTTIGAGMVLDAVSELDVSDESTFGELFQSISYLEIGVGTLLFAGAAIGSELG